MSDDGATLPSGKLAGLPVELLELRVLTGSDAGRTLVVESEALTIGSSPSNDLVLRDPTVSRFHVEIRRVPGSIRVRDCGSTNGTHIGPLHLDGVEVGTELPFTLALGQSEVAVSRGAIRMAEPPRRERVGRLVGESEGMLRVYETIRRLAAHDSNVLVQGESGTGKELIAEAIVATSRRATGPFVTIDCGALPSHLVTSELFGHERGAFTGADRKHLGAFERAHGGTLFLDEVGELPRDLQPALLGVLERKRLRRVGGTNDVPVDVRVISATHRDLRSSVNDGSFRLDLYHRLAVVRLGVPPLRERADDIPALVRQFLAELGVASPPPSLHDPAAIAALSRYAWPGNVRELKNHVEAVVAVGDAELGHTARGTNESSAAGAVVAFRVAKAAATAEFERRYLESLMLAADGNVRGAARLAQMDRTYLAELLERHGVRRR